ncbi:MAG: hypothetical protein AAF892_10845, partial [Cyanobacteria bacterium P01_D01_bin.71]
MDALRVSGKRLFTASLAGLINVLPLIFAFMARSSIQPKSTIGQPRVKVRVPLGWFWPLFWSGLMVGSGVFGLWALTWLTRIPPLPDCEKVTVASADGDRLICAQSALRTGSARSLMQAVQLAANYS